MTSAEHGDAPALETTFEGDRWVVRHPDGTVVSESKDLVEAVRAATGEGLTPEAVALLETVGPGNGAVCNIKKRPAADAPT